MSRCNSCKYTKFPGGAKCVRNDCVLFNKGLYSYCTCVEYEFDRREDCPKYKQNTEEQEESQ